MSNQQIETSCPIRRCSECGYPVASTNAAEICLNCNKIGTFIPIIMTDDDAA